MNYNFKRISSDHKATCFHLTLAFEELNVQMCKVIYDLLTSIRKGGNATLAALWHSLQWPLSTKNNKFTFKKKKAKTSQLIRTQHQQHHIWLRCFNQSCFFFFEKGLLGEWWKMTCKMQKSEHLAKYSLSHCLLQYMTVYDTEPTPEILFNAFDIWLMCTAWISQVTNRETLVWLGIDFAAKNLSGTP